MERPNAENATPEWQSSLSALGARLGVDPRTLASVATRAGRFYEPFDLRAHPAKRWRHIDNPISTLKTLQQAIRRQILDPVELPDHVVGGVAGNSVRTNAALHTQQPAVLVVDLEDHFARIDNDQVFKTFRSLGASAEVARFLTKLTTFQRRLPQGAPTSMRLAALTMRPMYEELDLVAQRLGLQWSVYVDDLTFSGSQVRDAVEPIAKVVAKWGQSLHRAKTKVMPSSDTQSVTGVLVNRRPSIPRQTREQIYWDLVDLGNRLPGEVTRREIERVRGKIASVRSVCPSQGMRLERLAARFLPDLEPVDGPGRPRAEVQPCSDAARHDRHGRNRQKRGRRDPGSEGRPAAE